MKVAITASLLAVAGCALAQQQGAAASEASLISSIPPCAITCFTKALPASGCSVEDAYCQCTTGAEKILKVALPCMCASKCTAQDLQTIQEGSTKMCQAALQAKGQTYNIPQGMSISEDTCKQIQQAAAGGSYGGSGSAPASTAPTTAPTTAPANVSAPTSTAPASMGGAMPGMNKTNASTTGPAPGKFSGAASRLNYVGESALVALMGAAMWAL